VKAQKEFRVIQQLAQQDFERDRSIAHRNLFGEEDGPHAACSQAPDDAIPTRHARRKLGLSRSYSGSQTTPLAGTKVGRVGIALLAYRADAHCGSRCSRLV
jgi:hypothetical protein